MRILVGHNRYKSQGGEDTVFAAEVALLLSMGHTVIRFEEDNERIDTLGLAATAVKTIWSRESKSRLSAVIASEKPDIAHFHNTFPLISPAAYYACVEAGIPVIQTLHNFRLLCPKATLMRDGAICEKCVGKKLAWPAVAHACYHDSRLRSANIALMLGFHHLLKTWRDTVSGYIALTNFAKAKFTEGGLPSDKIFVKPNFVDDKIARQQSDSAGYALFVGRLSEEKGIDLLIEAMTQVKQLPLKIIGDGPLGKSIDEEIKKRGLHNVERLGQLPYADVLRHLDSAACVVVPSRCYEGFSMAIVEAYSRGVPVIAAHLGSLAEIVEDQITGLHFSNGNATELADRLNWACANKTTLHDMGQRAYLEYSKKYNPGRNYELLMAIYEDVLSRPR